MPSAKEIKSRIASIKDTQKITNAMYLISSTKLRKAKNELNRTRPYFDALKGEIKRIFRTVPDVDSRYFYPPAGAPKLEGEYACLVITADKGMAGAYNHNVLKIAREMLHEHPSSIPRRIRRCTAHAKSAISCWNVTTMASSRNCSLSIPI